MENQKLFLGDRINVKLDPTGKRWHEAEITQVCVPHNAEPYITARFLGTNTRRDIETSEFGSTFIKLGSQ